MLQQEKIFVLAGPDGLELLKQNKNPQRYIYEGNLIQWALEDFSFTISITYIEKSLKLPLQN